MEKIQNIKETRRYQIIKIINNIIPLLATVDDPLTNNCREFLTYTLGLIKKPHNLSDLAENILRIYGDMGSFNDLCIYINDGDAIEMENDLKLRALRTELFLACKETIAQYKQ